MLNFYYQEAACTVSIEFLGSAGLINNVTSVGGDHRRQKVNQMLVQPIINYKFPHHPGRYLSFSPIITAKWEANRSTERWTVPIGLGIGQLTHWGE